MTTVEATEAHEAVTDEHGDEHHEHMSDGQYVAVAAVLAVITALEVAASYVDLGWAFLPILLALMAIKFLVVVRVFMHLKFDSKIFSWMFFSGLLLALGVYVVALLTALGLHGIVLLEDRELERRFGEEYRAWARRVPRYVPRRGPSRTPGP